MQGIRDLSASVWDAPLRQAMVRGGIRAGETSLEAGVLAAMKDEDPINAMVLGFGGQIVGSAALKASQGLLGNHGANLAVAGAATLALLQTFKEATPGGRDRILESSESAFAKLALLLGVAGLSSLAGAGRVGGPSGVGTTLRRTQPELADAITTIPRAGVLSLLGKVGQDAQADAEVQLVLQQLADDPSYFGPTAQRRFWRSLHNADAPDLYEMVDGLKADRRFKRRLDALFEPTEFEKLMERTPTHPINRGN
jgi:hypothetical protein